MPLEIHIGGPASAPLTQQVAFIKRAEDLGFDGVGIADNVQDGHDVYMALALAAEQTSKIELYPAITNPVTRHPFVLASLANSLAELAPGRTKLAIGTGDTGVAQAGLRSATMNELRQAVQTIQQLLRGDSVGFAAGGEGRIHNPIAPPTPVAVAASGPRALELAAEIGDEVMLTVGLDPRIVKAVELHWRTARKRLVGPSATSRSPTIRSYRSTAMAKSPARRFIHRCCCGCDRACSGSVLTPWGSKLLPTRRHPICPKTPSASCAGYLRSRVHRRRCGNSSPGSRATA